jgi:hypothetical protein
LRVLTAAGCPRCSKRSEASRSPESILLIAPKATGQEQTSYECCLAGKDFSKIVIPRERAGPLSLQTWGRPGPCIFVDGHVRTPRTTQVNHEANRRSSELSFPCHAGCSATSPAQPKRLTLLKPSPEIGCEFAAEIKGSRLCTAFF